jgi:hypothetical protein
MCEGQRLGRPVPSLARSHGREQKSGIDTKKLKREMSHRVVENEENR